MQAHWFSHSPKKTNELFLYGKCGKMKNEKLQRKIEKNMRCMENFNMFCIRTTFTWIVFLIITLKRTN